ncbi:hypothetical protein B6V72_14025 [Thioclava sp. F34-6]|uniref:DUF2188 domain-containing protein n=1 Tax=Thioclava sp. F34-6 TaxID=1973003 RepID=UPI000B539A38|nr:DUF2188 domain-containing protein [Thioclava sp. F34-6]OWY12223.1 hypothetical protein B6V72_14025 [Thioclava sp. F34-6]
MSDGKNYWTQRRPDGNWESRREGGERASHIAPTQEQAWERTRDLARTSGGEAYLRGRNGQIRERNTYGKDPYPPKG